MPSSESRVSTVKPENQLLEDFRAELDDYYQKLLEFNELEATDILATLSALTARASFIRTHIIRQEDKMLQNFRTKELDPFISECDRQFKIWSRLISANQFEWEMSRS